MVQGTSGPPVSAGGSETATGVSRSVLQTRASRLTSSLVARQVRDVPLRLRPSFTKGGPGGLRDVSPASSLGTGCGRDPQCLWAGPPTRPSGDRMSGGTCVRLVGWVWARTGRDGVDRRPRRRPGRVGRDVRVATSAGPDGLDPRGTTGRGSTPRPSPAPDPPLGTEEGLLTRGSLHRQ